MNYNGATKVLELGLGIKLGKGKTYRAYPLTEAEKKAKEKEFPKPELSGSTRLGRSYNVRLR